MSLINRIRTSTIPAANSHLFTLARAKVPSIVNFASAGRHELIKQLVLVNSALFGAYMLVPGPMGLLYKKYFTLDAGSSILSLPLCHFGHTSAATFLFNSAVLWTLGHYHATKYGAVPMLTVFGVGCVAATALGVMDVRNNAHQVIAGGMGGSAALITYNCFANGKWVNFMRLHPMIWLSALAAYGAFGNDKAAVGGIAGGYLAFLLL